MFGISLYNFVPKDSLYKLGSNLSILKEGLNVKSLIISSKSKVNEMLRGNLPNERVQTRYVESFI